MNEDKLEHLENEAIATQDGLNKTEFNNRRDSLIKMRDARTIMAKRSAVLSFILGLVFFSATIYFWNIQFNRSLQSNLGIIAGLLLSVIGFQYLYANRVTSYKKLFSDDFSDEELLTYLQENEKIDRKAKDQWRRVGRYIVLACGVILVFLINFDSTEEFGIMLLFTGLSLYLLGIAVLVLLPRPKS